MNRYMGQCEQPEDWRPQAVLTTSNSGRSSTVADKHCTQLVEYRAIPGFPGYRVGSDGTVWSEWSQTGNQYTGVPWEMVGVWHQLKPSYNRGYKILTLHANGQRVSRCVHRLVLLAFSGERPPNMQARHLDGNKDNNAIDNLKWGTAKENCADRSRHNHGLLGERNHQAKLTIEQASKIIDALDNGERPYLIAKQLGIKRYFVHGILYEGRWRRAVAQWKSVTAAETEGE